MVRMSRKERLHVTLPEDLLRALEVRRDLEGKQRSEALEEAVRCWLAGRDAEDLERRLGIASKLRDMEELLFSLRDQLRELALKNLYSGERVYALFEGQFDERLRLSREEASRVAHERVSRMRWNTTREEE
jgi:hypothetical protein